MKESILNTNGQITLLTAEQAKDFLGFKSVQTIYRWVQRGWIEAIGFGSRNIRFSIHELEYIKKNGTRLLKEKKSYIPRNSNPRNNRPRSSAKAERKKYLWE